VIYICIPAHDEAETIGVLLWKIRKVMGEFDRDYRILVLDDASTDGTSDVVQRYRKVLPVTALRSDERLGYGAALERLLRQAAEDAPYPKRDAVVTMQADFTEDPADLVSLVKAVEGGADVVAGAVTDPGARLPQGLRWARRLAPWVVGRAFGQAPVSDPLSGFRAYRVIVLRKMFREAGDGALLPSDSWSANVALLRRVAPHARRIDESPLELRYHLHTRPSRFRPWRSLRELLAFRGVLWGTGESEKTA
jgi:dolichol-phosphate mannosyltransferase